MRSCEYSQVQGERKTKLLRLRNIHFYHNNRKTPPTHGIKFLLRASSVSITFISQKNDEQDQTITMHRSNHILCPVKAWALLTLRILSYPGATLDLPVNIFLNGNSPALIYSKDILSQIRTTVTVLGENVLGLQAKRVGCHSIRSSFAMFLYMQNIRTDKIMLQGRWRSDAFLLYIRTQVSNFSNGLSNAMMQDSSIFYTVSTDQTNSHTDLPFRVTPSVPNIPHTNNNGSKLQNFDIVTDPGDPRNRNVTSFASNLHNNNGPNANNSRVLRPNFFSIFTYIPILRWFVVC